MVDLNLNLKAARKFQPGRKTAYPLFLEESDGSSEKSQDESEASSTVSESTEEDELSDDDFYKNTPEPIFEDNESDRLDGPSEELMTALEALTLSSLQMQMARKLPFLLRNLRRGFENRCRLLRVPVDTAEHAPVFLDVLYKHDVTDEEGLSHSHNYLVRKQVWCCPMCEILGVFKTREMLAKHIEWDHPEVTTNWEQVNEVGHPTYVASDCY